MSDSTTGDLRLPPGPRLLAREVVEAHQRDRILHALLEVVARDGYEASSVSRVAKHAGVSTATFYQLYDNRPSAFWDMYDAAFASLLAPALAVWDEPDATTEAPDRLRRCLGTLLGSVAADPDVARVVVTEAAWLGPRFFERREQHLHRLSERIEHAAREHNGAASPIAARSIVAAVWVLVEEHVAAGSAALLPSLTDDLDQIVRTLFEQTDARLPDRVSSAALARYQRVLDRVYAASRELMDGAPSWQVGLYASLIACYTEIRSDPESLWLHFVDTSHEETVAVRTAHSARLLALLHELRDDAPSKHDGTALLRRIHAAMRASILEKGEAIDLDAAERTFATLLLSDGGPSVDGVPESASGETLLPVHATPRD